LNVSVMLRESPPVVRISISPWLRLTTLGNFSPHSTKNDAGRTDQVIEPKRIKLAFILDAVEVQVVEHHRLFAPLDGARAFVFVNQREGRAGYLVGIGGVERFRDALHQRRLAGAQIAAQDEELRRRQHFRNAVADGDGFFAAVAFELVHLQVRCLRHLDLTAEEGSPSTQTYPASSHERK
jgi:hypothetical protein